MAWGGEASSWELSVWVDDGAIHNKGSWGGGTGLGQRGYSPFEGVEFEAYM